MAKEYTLGNRSCGWEEEIGIDKDTGKMKILSIQIENKIPSKIADYRDRNGCTVKWIAQQLGMSTQNLYKIFDSENITLLTLVRISNFLKCNIEDLYEYSVNTELVDM